MTADTTQSQCQSLFNKHCRKKKTKPRTSTGLSLRSVKFIVRFSPIASVPKSSWPLDISGRWCITCTYLHFVTGAVFKTLLSYIPYCQLTPKQKMLTAISQTLLCSCYFSKLHDSKKTNRFLSLTVTVTFFNANICTQYSTTESNVQMHTDEPQ